MKIRDIDAIRRALRPRMAQIVAPTGPVVPTTLPVHTHSADKVSVNPAGNIAADDVQEALEELDSEKLARDGSQDMLGNLDMGGNPIIDVQDIAFSGGVGEAIIGLVRRVTMTGIATIESVLKLDFTGAGVGDGIIDQPRVIHMAGDDSDSEARIDGLERVVFNDEVTKSLIVAPSAVQFNASVAAGTDTTHQEGQAGWDAAERTLVQDAPPAAYDSGTEFPRFSMGWAVINCRNGSGGMIAPARVVYVSGGSLDSTPTPGVYRPAVTEWDGTSEAPGLTLGTAQRIIGLTLHGSDNGQPVQVVRRGILRGLSDGGEGWVIGDTIWADRGVVGGLTKTIEPLGEYPRIFVGTVIDDTGTEGPWAVDVDMRVLPTLAELSFVEQVTLADYFVPVYDQTGGSGWVPGILPAVGVGYTPGGALIATDVQAALDELEAAKAGRRWLWMMGD